MSTHICVCIYIERGTEINVDICIYMDLYTCMYFLVGPLRVPSTKNLVSKNHSQIEEKLKY